jgi:hypothetical protein
LPVLAFRRDDGSYVAVIANYAMHNVALPPENRHISADVAGAAARSIRDDLPGQPTVLFTNGGCGNVNPPASSTDFGVMEQFGRLLGRAATYTARFEAAVCEDAILASELETVELPLSVLTPAQVEREYQAAIGECVPGVFFWENARRAYDDWRNETLALLAQGDPPRTTVLDLQAVRLGPVRLVAIGAEVFSHMALDLRAAAGPGAYVVGYANGDIGYLPPREIYAEGGYEVTMAYKFYGHFMVAPGAFETVRERALALLRTL